MDHDVFISYSSQDKKAAHAICHALEQNSIRCWMAPRDIPAGSQYGDVIDDAIKSCKIVVVLFSEPAAASPWVNGELNVAFEEQKTIIPFRLDQTPLKGQNRVMLNQKHWIDAYPDYKTKFNDLIKAVTIALGWPNNANLTKPGRIKESKKTLRKWPFILLMAFTAIGILFWIAMKTGGKQTVYIYDRDDLHVMIEHFDQKQVPTMNEILDNMVLVKGGTFFMGLSSKDSLYLTENDILSLPVHKVTLSDYYISKYELTQQQWQMLFDVDEVSQNKGIDKPVDYLSWQAAKQYADSLSIVTGIAFSLPTEAQWEYAVRGGQQSEGHIYAGSDDFNETGWLHDADAYIHEVGEKSPNELGLYDMIGNVQELCLDYFSNYTSFSDTNPTGPKTGKTKIVRGGSIHTSPFEAKNASRGQCEPSFNSRATGMRLVINLN